MPGQYTLSRSFRHAIFSILVLAFLVGCQDDEPIVFGNDGATLNNLNLNGALALLSNTDGTYIQDSKGMSFSNMKLYTLSQGGILAELPMSFSGNPNGGTNHYTLYRLNERYSILTFYTRLETYIIDQANGEVHKSIYLGQPADCMAGENEFYFTDLYALNTEHVFRYFKVSNFLSEDAEKTERSDEHGTLILDQHDNLYSFSYAATEGDIIYHNNGNETKIASAIAAYNDHESKLNVVTKDGDISWIENGSVHEKVSLTDVSLSRSQFETYAFPEQQKTLALLRNNITHSLMIYDVTSGQKKLNLSSLEGDNFYFNFTSASAFDKYLFLLGSIADSAAVIRIDVTDYSHSKALFYNSDILHADDLIAVSDKEMISTGCTPQSDPPGTCQPRVMYFNMAKNAKVIFERSDLEGQVVRLSDNQ